MEGHMYMKSALQQIRTACLYSFSMSVHTDSQIVLSLMALAHADGLSSRK